MNIIRFFSQIMALLVKLTGNVFPAICLYTLAISVISIPVTKFSYKNIALSKQMRPRLKEIKERYRKDSRKEQAKTQELLLEYRYGIFASMIATVVQMVMGIGMALGVAASDIEADPVFLTLNVRLSPSNLRDSAGNATIYLIAIVMIGLVLQLIHDALLEKELITEQHTLDLLITFGIAVAILFLPLGFAIYWIVHEMMDILFMGVFGKLSVKEKR